MCLWAAHTDPLGNTTTVGYDGVGNRVVQIDPLGYRTTWTYNVFDKPVRQQDALGSVVTTVNPAAQVLNTYRYKPYGVLW